MSTAPVAPAQPEPAEGPRADEPATGKPQGEGVSAPDPAEGADDAPSGGSGSPD
ncbi:hypothetical protein Q4F19_05880 [Sphingomonas sp. BIUV-7]|uniref:Uncharacterized protein n=1 Tax=Sphingomonas natans TaxID=3063330 RepID=A0ABT8Y6F1_9SPHN|nr:hypothetical protein [Sphingomonas sp. BIUV-7]MDO6413904.1 hypothetical protein [Sphingomonas sp. BIUV-7]